MEKSTKEKMIETLTARSIKIAKSWTVAKLQAELTRTCERMAVHVASEKVTPRGNWNTAKDWFPTINIDQSTRTVNITTFSSSGRQKNASVETESISTDMSESGDSLFVRGSVDVHNWRNNKCSGSQEFCFAVFVGDTGHIYVHRASATKGWMTADPAGIRKRLRKLGIGANKNVVQQGDFLLKPANGHAAEDHEFKHETMGAGHHKFEMPVLYAYKKGGRQYKITEPTKLIHTATDGIQHPTQIVPPGIWIVGTTASQLWHSNARD